MSQKTGTNSTVKTQDDPSCVCVCQLKLMQPAFTANKGCCNPGTTTFSPSQAAGRAGNVDSSSRSNQVSLAPRQESGSSNCLGKRKTSDDVRGDASLSQKAKREDTGDGELQKQVQKNRHRARAIVRKMRNFFHKRLEAEHDRWKGQCIDSDTLYLVVDDEERPKFIKETWEKIESSCKKWRKDERLNELAEAFKWAIKRTESETEYLKDLAKKQSEYEWTDGLVSALMEEVEDKKKVIFVARILEHWASEREIVWTEDEIYHLDFFFLPWTEM